MDFQQEKYAKGATGYDQRIRNTFLFYETIHPTIMPCCEALCLSFSTVQGPKGFQQLLKPRVKIVKLCPAFLGKISCPYHHCRHRLRGNKAMRQVEIFLRASIKSATAE
jgi:hypothetical protein